MARIAFFAAPSQRLPEGVSDDFKLETYEFCHQVPEAKPDFDIALIDLRENLKKSKATLEWLEGQGITSICIVSSELSAEYLPVLESGLCEVFQESALPYLSARLNTVVSLVNSEIRVQELHAQLIQSEKMAALGQLAAGVAHEINNPIGFISSNINLVSKYTEKLAEELNGLETSLEQDDSGMSVLYYNTWKSTSRYFNFLNDLNDVVIESKDGLERIKQIVKDLKDYTHVGSQNFEYIDLNSLLQSTVNLLRNEIKYKAEVVFGLDDLPQIQAIGSQISQVLVNIIMNACQAIDEFGEIKVLTHQDGDYLEITISDNGCGIEAEALAKIFEAFYTTKAVGEGTGIGLAITKSIIDRHHGKIEVRSTAGEGTSFHIRLPVEQPEDPAEVEEA